MMTPDDIDVWVGLDVGKSAHHAHALDHDGNTLYDKPLKQDEKAIRTMLGKLSKHGRVLLVVDQPRGCLIVCVWDHLIERKRSW